MANRKVLVRGLSLSVDVDEMTLYFESHSYCPLGGDVLEVDLKGDGTAIITFDDAFVAERLISIRNLSMNNHELSVESYKPTQPPKQIHKGEPGSEPVSTKESRQSPVQMTFNWSSVFDGEATEEKAENPPADADKQNDEGGVVSFAVTLDASDYEISEAAARKDCEIADSGVVVDKEDKLADASSGLNIWCTENISSKGERATDNGAESKTDIMSLSHEKLKILKMLHDSGKYNIFDTASTLRFDVDNHQVCITGRSAESNTKVRMNMLELLISMCNERVQLGSRAVSLLRTDHGAAWLEGVFREKRVLAVYHAMDSGGQLLTVDSDELERANRVLRDAIICREVPFDDAVIAFVRSAEYKKKIEELTSKLIVAIETNEERCSVVVEGFRVDVESTADELDALFERNSNTELEISAPGYVLCLLKRHHEQEMNSTLSTTFTLPIKLKIENDCLRISGNNRILVVADKIIKFTYIDPVCRSQHEVNEPGQELKHFVKHGTNRDMIEKLEEKFRCSIQVLQSPNASSVAPVVGKKPGFIATIKSWLSGPSPTDAAKKTSKSTIVVKQGSIAEFSEADILVNLISTRKSLSLADSGQVATAFLKVGGTELQQEFEKAGMPHKFGTDVTVTPATGNLKAKKIFHAAIRSCNDESSLEKLYNLIMICLRMAVAEKLSSIAFPTLGCGKLGYYPEDVAGCFWRAACDTDATLQIFIVSYGRYLIDIFITRCRPGADMPSAGASGDPSVVASAVSVPTTPPIEDDDVSECAALTSSAASVALQRAFVFHICSLDPASLVVVMEKLKGYFSRIIVGKEINMEAVAYMSKATEQAITKLKPIDVDLTTDRSRQTISLRGKPAAIKSLRAEIKKLLVKEELSSKLQYVKQKYGVQRYLQDVGSMPEINLPSYWTKFTGVYRADQVGNHRSELDNKSALFLALKDVVMKTWDPTKAGGLGHDAQGLSHTQISVSKIWAVENPTLFNKYMAKKKQFCLHASQNLFTQLKGMDNEDEIETRKFGFKILDENLILEINEYYLLHGTMRMDVIESSGFDSRVSSDRALFGNGTYFAESSTKADQYADQRDTRVGKNTPLYMFVARVPLGITYISRKPSPFKRPPCVDTTCANRNECKNHSIGNSVVGTHTWAQPNMTTRRLIFREFVIYHPDQSYPDFLVEYERL